MARRHRGEQSLTAGEVKEKALSAMDTNGALHKAISAVACAPGRNEIDALRLGKWLGRNKGRIVGDLKLLGDKQTDSKQMVWWLERADKAAA